MAAVGHTHAVLQAGSYVTAILLGFFVVTHVAIRLPTIPPAPVWVLGRPDTTVRCKQKYHCNTSKLEVQECSCHPYCYLFDSCCVDAQLPSDWKQLQLPRDLYTCINFSALTNGGYTVFKDQLATFVVDKCPSMFASPTMAILCQHPLEQTENGTLSTLVTDASSGATYRNIFCALCHNNAISALQRWDYGNYCNGTDQTALSDPSSLVQCSRGYRPPQNITLHDCRENSISSCPQNSSQFLQADCLNFATQYAYDQVNKITYRNWNCSQCNASPGANISCVMWDLPVYLNGGTLSLGLSVLLTPDYHCPTSLTPYMSDQEQTAWKYLCPGIYDYRNNIEFSKCSGFPNKQTLADLYSNDTYLEYGISANHVWVRYNATYTACAECKSSAYTMNTTNNETEITVNNTTFIWPFFKQVGHEVLTCSALLPDGSLLVCSDLPETVGIVFMVLSEFGLLLYALAYALLQSLRNLPGQIMLHESTAFFLGFLLFLLRQFASDSDLACEIIGILVHFFFLAAFSWTSIYAIEVVRALGFQAYGAGFKKRRLRYIIIGWTVPALIMVASLATNYATANNTFRPNYGRPQCFINSPLGNRIFFIAPLAVFLSIDTVIYMYVIVKLVMISRETKMVRNTHNEKLILSVKLVLALGIFWIFAILGAATSACAILYIFQLLNTLQGVSIFAIFVCNKKTYAFLHPKAVRGKSITSGTGTVHLRDSSVSTTSSRISRKDILGVQSFSPTSLSMDSANSNKVT